MPTSDNIKKILNTVRTKIQRANAFWKEDNFEGAIKEYKDALVFYNKYNGNPEERIQIISSIASGYAKLGDYKNSIKYYEILYKEEHRNLNLYNYLAQQYSDYDCEKELDCCLKALDLAPQEGSFISACWLIMKNLKYSQKEFKDFCEKYVNIFRPNYLSKMPAFKHSKPDRNKKLKIGYVSTDFYCHAMMSFVLPIIEYHNFDKYEIILYSINSKHDAVTERLKKTGVNFVDLSEASVQQIAQKIYDDKIDIVVDLSGYVNTKAFWLFYKPAPIQMQYMGFLNTYGMKEVDYIITDKFSIPEEIADEYTEKPLYLEHGMEKYCFSSPNTKLPSVNPAPPCLINGYVTFGSFNTINKIDNETIALWVKVMEAVPNSRLLIYRTQMNDKVKEGLIRLLERNNADMSRVILKNDARQDSHFKIYEQADIALDPLPFSGLTVTVETMLMGVPVLCMCGETLQSKGTTRINQRLGMRRFIAENKEDYIEKAKQLSKPEVIINLRNTLRNHIMSSDLFNNYKEIAEDFENCFNQAWEDYCKKQEV